MKTRANPEKSLAQAIVNLALHWLAVQDGHNLPEQVEAEFMCSWTFPRPVELALLPDSRRAVIAVTQELFALLGQFPEGWQALHDLGFQLVDEAPAP